MRFKAKTQTYLNHARSSGPEEAFFLFLLFRFNASVLQIKDPRKTRNIYCMGMKHAQPLVFTRLYILSLRGKGSFNLLSVYMNFFQLNFLLRRRSCIKHKKQTTQIFHHHRHHCIWELQKKQISSNEHH